MTGVTAVLQSRSPFVRVDDPHGAFGNIASGARARTTDPFTLHADPLTYRGHQAPMLLILTNAQGAIDSASLQLTVGTAAAIDPTGPDAYGYFAYDNSDSPTNSSPTYNYLEHLRRAGHQPESERCRREELPSSH